MRHRYCAFSLFVLCSVIISEAADDWTYSDQENWVHVSKECGGSQQSPINIQQESLVVNETLQLEYVNYNSSILAFKAMNNYHTIKLNYIGDVNSAPRVTGPAVNGEPYTLEQLHVHWGSKRGIGSEHVIDGLPYSMELHLVHYNRDKYKSIAKALEAHEGILVVAVLFKIHREENPNLAELTRMVHELKDKDLNYHINPEEPLVVGNFMPPEVHWNRFYHYQGSLTTPPCTEAVKWFVLSEPIYIGLEQINQFRLVKNNHGANVSDNFRATQNLAGRPVFSSFKVRRPESSSPSHASVTQPGVISILATMLLIGLARM